MYYICNMKDQLLKLLTHFKLTATRFADEIGVQRSGISHILSGRNEPSYDFIVKIMKKYPEINLDWLILGKGNMMKSEMNAKSALQKDLFSSIDSNSSSALPLNQETHKKIKYDTTDKKVTNVTNMDQIVIFFSDGTCKSYLPESKE